MVVVIIDNLSYDCDNKALWKISIDVSMGMLMTGHTNGEHRNKYLSQTCKQAVPEVMPSSHSSYVLIKLSFVRISTFSLQMIILPSSA